MNAATSRWFDRLWIAARLAFWPVAVIYAVELSRRAIVLSDEGCLMSQVTAMLEGRELYRDIDLFVTPGIWYLLEAVFSFTGPGLLPSRMVAAFGLVATMLAARVVVRQVAGPKWADLAPVLIAVFSMWAYPAWSVAFYSPWSALFGLCALAALLAWMRSASAWWLLLSGLACGASFVFKQNYGAYAAIGVGLAVVVDRVLHRRNEETWSAVALDVLRAGIPTVAGFALAVLPVLALLHSSGSLEPALHSLFVRPFEGFAGSHAIRYLAFGDFGDFRQLQRAAGYIYRAVPMSMTDIAYRWPSWALWTIDALHWGLYWIPPFLFVGVFARAWRRRGDAPMQDRGLVAIAVFTVLFFLGVFPRADLNHLINVYQPVLCLAVAAAAIVFAPLQSARRPLRLAGAGLAAVVTLGYCLVAAAWMNDVRKLFVHPVVSPRGGVLVTEDEAARINHEVAVVREMTSPGEPVFAVAAVSMIPFLAERPMPTRYHNYYAVHVGFDRGESAAREIEESGTRVVVAEYENFFADPVGMLTYAPALTDYLARTFVPARTVAGQRHMILVRRDEPRAAVPSEPLWPMCRGLAGGIPAAQSREHLLFTSIHHVFGGMWGNDGEALSACRLRVLDGSTLHLLLELRQLDESSTDGSATASVWVWPDDGAPTELLSTSWPLARSIGLDGPELREFDIALQPWAGRTVSLLLRSRVRGEVQIRTMDPGRIGVAWHAVSVESDGYTVGPPEPRVEAAPR